MLTEPASATWAGSLFHDETDRNTGEYLRRLDCALISLNLCLWLDLVLTSAFSNPRADYSEVGGAPLLGVNGIVIICHGSSRAHTIRNAIKHAQECAEQKLNEKIWSNYNWDITHCILRGENTPIESNL